MSLSQTYFIASSARQKLGKEACRPDHNLRLLVGHANLLDSLMLELRDAEREQEAWFNQSVQKAKKADEPRHIQWIDTIAENDEEAEEEDSDSDSDSEFDESDFEMTAPLRRLRSPPVSFSSKSDVDDEEDVYEDDEYSPELALTRTESHPPELTNDSDSDDESPPASPPQPTFEYDEKAAAADLALLHQTKLESSLFVHSMIPENNATLIEAY